MHVCKSNKYHELFDSVPGICGNPKFYQQIDHTCEAITVRCPKQFFSKKNLSVFCNSRFDNYTVT